MSKFETSGRYIMYLNYRPPRPCVNEEDTRRLPPPVHSPSRTEPSGPDRLCRPRAQGRFRPRTHPPRHIRRRSSVARISPRFPRAESRYALHLNGGDVGPGNARPLRLERRPAPLAVARIRHDGSEPFLRLVRRLGPSGVAVFAGAQPRAGCSSEELIFNIFRPADIPEILWFEEGNEVIKSCAALSSALGLQKSFSTSDISQLSSPTENAEHLRPAVSDIALSRTQRYSYMTGDGRLEASSRSCSTWVAVGDVTSASQLPSPHGHPSNPHPSLSPADLVRSVNKKGEIDQDGGMSSPSDNFQTMTSKLCRQTDAHRFDDVRKAIPTGPLTTKMHHYHLPIPLATAIHHYNSPLPLTTTAHHSPPLATTTTRHYHSPSQLSATTTHHHLSPPPLTSTTHQYHYYTPRQLSLITTITTPHHNHSPPLPLTTNITYHSPPLTTNTTYNHHHHHHHSPPPPLTSITHQYHYHTPRQLSLTSTTVTPLPTPLTTTTHHRYRSPPISLTTHHHYHLPPLPHTTTTNHHYHSPPPLTATTTIYHSNFITKNFIALHFLNYITDIRPTSLRYI
ncbi:unnamed protein product [Nesidiocoris tenuis]|uniref:Uncharacterized protein n=1 Tax=Nesidiocoris tenuis TaxID=355587 RepID=A0A6H5HJM4_9HEMI|nr:unnamed protein product [Nesidiocoris tenuis]